MCIEYRQKERGDEGKLSFFGWIFRERKNDENEKRAKKLVGMRENIGFALYGFWRVKVRRDGRK